MYTFGKLTFDTLDQANDYNSLITFDFLSLMEFKREEEGVYNLC